jgi:hypothetical protein
MNSNVEVSISFTDEFIKNSTFLLQIEDNVKPKLLNITKSTNRKFKNFIALLFLYTSEYTFDKEPFEIVIEKEGKKTLIIIIILILLIIIACAICVISIIIFYKQRKQRLEYLRRRDRHRQEVDERNKKKIEEKKKKKNLIKEFLNERLFRSKFRDLNENAEKKCSICLEEFLPETEICITDCHHFYHFECMKKWMNDNVEHIKCPLCNFVFIHDDIKVSEIKNTNNNYEIIKKYKENASKNNYNNYTELEQLNKNNSLLLNNNINNENLNSENDTNKSLNNDNYTDKTKITNNNNENIKSISKSNDSNENLSKIPNNNSSNILNNNTNNNSNKNDNKNDNDNNDNDKDTINN